MENDSNGHKRALHFDRPPQRVVSLVPSLTESLFDLGVGEALVGVTDYCIHPAEKLAHLPRLGGTKNPRVAEIIALQPDLVLANWEENTRRTVEELEAAGAPVWVTLPLTVRETLEMLHTLAALFRSTTADLRVQMLDLTLDWAISAAQGSRGMRYFCPIWQDTTQSGQLWWMTFNQQTYCHDLLEISGGVNVFAERQRRYPLAADLGLAPAQPAPGRDLRYPRVTLDEILSAQPEVILLPDEPYPFTQQDVEQMARLFDATPAARENRIHLVEGSLITWAGTRLARALRELPTLLERHSN
ncbi:MAG: helical backbone metal receptor [Anaerolineales bacterium]|jgi:ABC-type Fe3+-hydroxamate transport system substrate-binding protein|nr:helical backbone metal receptor [Anaerolineales bacterium]